MSGLSIVLSGMLAGDPGQAGASWAVLQYLLGLERLGHHVTLVEPVTDLAASAAYFESLVAQFGLEGRAALWQRDTDQALGLSPRQIGDRVAGADLLLNVSGLLRDEDLLARVPTRVYLDLDPGFTQLWAAVEGVDMGLDRHTHHVTVGSLLGTDTCDVPLCGWDWTPTRPPVVLEHWTPASDSPRRGFTTIANLRSYGSIDQGARFVGQKIHSLRALTELPAEVRTPLELALAAHPAEGRDLDALRAGGWVLSDPIAAAGTPRRYHDYIGESAGEIGVAKSGYVVTRCGWFSDRSACYLARGRPVVAQDTGFGETLPTGAGLLAFTDATSAREALSAVEDDWSRHSAAARALAEEFFDSDVVLGTLLAAVS